MAKKTISSKKTEEATQETEEALQIFEAVAEMNPNLLEGIDANKQRELKKAFSVGISMVQQSHSGPLPMPETVEGYNKIR